MGGGGGVGVTGGRGGLGTDFIKRYITLQLHGQDLNCPR